MLGIPRNKDVYNQIKDYTKTYEKNNPDFPKNIVSYLDSADWPAIHKGPHIYHYTTEAQNNPYRPLCHVEFSSAILNDPLASYETVYSLDALFIFLAKQWVSREALYTAQKPGGVPLILEMPHEILPLFDLFILEHLLLELSKIKENKDTSFDYILGDQEAFIREFDGDGWGSVLGRYLSKASFFECFRQNEDSAFPEEFGSLYNCAYIRLIQEVGDHLVSIFTQWVSPIRESLPREFYQSVWSRLVNSLHRSLVYEIGHGEWLD